MRTLTLRLNEKDTELKRLISLAKERGETVSQYISLALQSYLFNGKYVCIAKVVPEEDGSVRTTSYSVPEPVFEKMEEITSPFGKRKKANFVKTVLLNSIDRSKDGREELSNLYDLARNINSERVVLFSNNKVSGDTPAPVIKEVPAAEEPADEIKQTKEVSAVKPEKNTDSDVPVNANSLLGGLFPNLQSQLSGWNV